MIDQQTRLETMIKDEIKKQSIAKGLDEGRIGYHLTESLFPVQRPNTAEPSMELTWILRLTYRLPLLGSEKPTLETPPIIIAGPAQGFMASDNNFRGSVSIGLDTLNTMQQEAMSQIDKMPQFPVAGETMPLQRQ